MDESEEKFPAMKNLLANREFWKVLNDDRIVVVVK